MFFLKICTFAGKIKIKMFFKGKMMFLKLRTKCMLACFLFAGSVFAENTDMPKDNKDNFVLVIDAGHGGHDIGAQGEYALEKDINLNIALELVRRLRAYPDITVVLTRQSDIYLTLDERAQIANEREADLFVSVHTNSSENNKIARGTETYFVGDAVCHTAGQVAEKENSSAHKYEKDYEEKYKNTLLLESARVRNMDNSELMARLVQEEYIKAGARVNRGVQQARFYVLMNTMMPAILTEVGFISTWDEESYLTSQKGVEEVSASIFNAILSYKKVLQEGKAKERLAELKISLNAQKTENVPMKLDPSMGIYDEATHQLALNGKTEKPKEKEQSECNEPKTAKEKKEDRSVEKKQSRQTERYNKAEKHKAKQPDAKETKKSSKLKAEEMKATENGIRFYIQLMAVREELPQKDQRLKGLWPVRYVKKGDFYKCLYFESTDYAAVRSKLKKISSDFPGAYVVAYDGDLELKVSEAVKKAGKKK